MTQMPPPPDSGSYQQAPYGPPPKKDLTVLWVGLGVGMVLLLACCFGGLFVVGMSDEANEDDPVSEASRADSQLGDDASGGGESPDESDASEQVEPLPFNASGLLGGNARPRFPEGEQGEVSVVRIGPLDTDRGILLFAFRNNTPAGISHVDWTATARSDGRIVSTGSSQGTIPDQIKPGEVGLSYLFFENGEAIPKGAEYMFEVETSPVDADSFNTAPLRVTEVNVSGDAIVGSATNETGFSTEGPYSVDIYCFDGDKLLKQIGSYAEQDGPIEDGGTVTFTVDLYGENCQSFVVGVGGYFS